MIQLVGRWIGISRIAVNERIQYRFDFLMTFVSTLIFSALYFMLWKAIYAHSVDHPMPWSELITYIMVAQAINFARWSPAERRPVYDMAARIRNGDVSLDLIRPIGFQTRRFFEAVGFFVVELLWVTIPAMLFFIFIIGIEAPANWQAILGFIVSLMIGFLVSFGLNSIVMMLSFWTTNAQGLQIARKALVELLAGTLIPFVFLPIWLQSIVTYLPFQAMAHTPISIYTGQVEGWDIVWALGEQLVWVAVMIAASRVIWYFASRKITVYGG